MQTQVENLLEQLFLCSASEVNNFDNREESITESVFAFSSSGHRFVN